MAHEGAGGPVDAPIGRNPLERKEMCVTAKNSKEAVTNYRVLQEYEGFSHLELRLETAVPIRFGFTWLIWGIR